jgi:hypothetical protein
LEILGGISPDSYRERIYRIVCSTSVGCWQGVRSLHEEMLMNSVCRAVKELFAFTEYAANLVPELPSYTATYQHFAMLKLTLP